MKHSLWCTALVFLAGMAGAPAQAATILVAAGETAFNPGNGICSLREAIRNGDTESDTSAGDCTPGSVGSNTIVLAANSTYLIGDRDTEHRDDQVNGLPEVHGDLIIEGNGATISRDPALFSGSACSGGGAKFRIFYISGQGSLALKNLTLSNGCADVLGVEGAGGALFNRGFLSLDGVTLTANQALRSGGAIHNDGSLTVTRSTISSNAVLATEAGGGGIVNRGAMQISQSTISGNTGAGAGGGIDTGVGNATLSNSTVSGNVAAGNGGGVFSRSPSTALVNTTVAANRGTNGSAAGAGSGVFGMAGTLQLTNTLLAQQANGTNCSGGSGGGNNLSDDNSCPTATNAAALIGPLANNGGPTFTHALLVGSPAINTASAAACSAAPQNGVDQRGQPRPQGAGCDIGAFEFEQRSAAGSGAAPIPTLGALGMWLLMSLMALAAMVTLRRGR